MASQQAASPVSSGRGKRSQEWDPPVRFQKDPNCQPPDFPPMEAEAWKGDSAQPPEESDEETELMHSYPPLEFKKPDSACPKEIDANPPSQQITAVLPSGPYYRVPPLLTICPYCDTLQAPMQPSREPTYCYVCKQYLY